MDDAETCIELYTVWGFEGGGVLTEDWDTALHYLSQAQQFIRIHAAQGALFMEAQVRVWLGTVQAALQIGRSDQAARLLALAEKAVLGKGLRWWVPTVYYWQGMWRLAKAQAVKEPLSKAVPYFQRAVSAVGEGGCP